MTDSKGTDFPRRITEQYQALKVPYQNRKVRSFGDYGAERDQTGPEAAIGGQELCVEKPAVPRLFTGPDRPRRQLSGKVVAEGKSLKSNGLLRGRMTQSDSNRLRFERQ